MHQLNTIMEAVALAKAANRSDAVPAILKHYLMDNAYVNSSIRNELLVAINKELNSKYSVTFIKKANPALLESLVLSLPVKEQLVVVDSLVGAVDLAVNQSGTVHTSQIPQALIVEENETMTTTTATVTIEDNSTAGAAPVSPKKVKIKTKSDKDSAGFENSLAKAIKKGNGKKSDHIKFSMIEGGLTKENLAAFYVFIKESIKKMVSGFKEVDQLKTAAKREETFNAWLATDKALKKEYKAFLKAADGQFEKSDTIISMFLTTSSSNVKNVADFVTFASTYKGTEDKSPYSFLRENDGGIRSGWAAAGSAVIMGALDQVQNGFTVGSIAGSVVGAGLSFYVAEQLDEHISNTYLRTAAAAALGAGMGVIGSRTGRYLIPTEVYPGTNLPEISDDTTVVATVPAAANQDSNEGGSLLSRIPGLGGLFGA